MAAIGLPLTLPVLDRFGAVLWMMSLPWAPLWQHFSQPAKQVPGARLGYTPQYESKHVWRCKCCMMMLSPMIKQVMNFFYLRSSLRSLKSFSRFDVLHLTKVHVGEWSYERERCGAAQKTWRFRFCQGRDAAREITDGFCVWKSFFLYWTIMDCTVVALN